MEDELDEAGPVAQVDEDQPAVVAAAVHPARDPRLASRPGRRAPGRTRCRGRSWRPGPGGSALIESAVFQPTGVSRADLGEDAVGADLALLARSPCRAAARCSSASRIDDALGADPVGVLELTLERCARRGRSRPTGRRARSSPASASARRRWPGRRRRRRTASRRVSPASSPEGQEDSLDAGSPADRRGRRTAELLDQAVVATAAADLGLGAEPLADEREDRPRVVVEAAHQGRVDHVLDAGRVEQARTSAKCSASSPSRRSTIVGAPAITAAGALVVGVEGAQRVDVDPLAHVLGELAPRWRAGAPSAPPGRHGAPRASRGCRAAARPPGRRARRAGSRAAPIDSASASGESLPIASAPIWWNWR